MKKFFTILIGCAVVLTLALGFNQIFIDKVDAGAWRCDWNMSCAGLKGEDCSDTLTCTCKGDVLTLCNIGAPDEAEQ